MREEKIGAFSNVLLRRLTRLTDAFSKKVKNHVCAVALYAMYYNFSFASNKSSRQPLQWLPK
jgi:hypothetical protein